MGARDNLQDTMWVHLFLKGPWYKMEENIKRYEAGGWIWTAKKLKHINIQYFWIKDRTKAGGITIQLWSILGILSYSWTKPLQAAPLLMLSSQIIVRTRSCRTERMKDIYMIDERADDHSNNSSYSSNAMDGTGGERVIPVPPASHSDDRNLMLLPLLGVQCKLDVIEHYPSAFNPCFENRLGNIRTVFLSNNVKYHDYKFYTSIKTIEAHEARGSIKTYQIW